MTDLKGLRAVVAGTGSATPDKVLSNRDLEKIVETSDEWIIQRTGIHERRICNDDETTGSLSIIAAQRALESSKTSAEEVDLIIEATVTGEYIWPATACFVQAAIGATNAGAFDISAACAGFIYAVANATSMIEAGHIRTALVVGADCLTKQVDWSDRSTCILFGDAAAACVLKAAKDTDRGVIETVLRADGRGAKHIILERGGSRWPRCVPESLTKSDTIFMAGQEVYRFAIIAMGDACEAVMRKAGIQTADVDLFVPHQANLRIIESASGRLGIPENKVFVNVDRYGNTSGASVPLALDEAVRQGRLKPGMLVMTVGFGAGLVWGANLIRW
ncbi:MAG TPA: beta-ketoacyl-ACP synthase III [Fimbriimonas sp.]|nr:beta-ketoacyl-ACP synthase III [Fimbriimonas sp.]